MSEPNISRQLNERRAENIEMAYVEMVATILLPEIVDDPKAGWPKPLQFSSQHNSLKV